MKTVLFYCPQMQTLAEKIVLRRPDEIELGSISWQSFEDSFPNLFISDVAGMVKGRDVAFLASFDTEADIFRQYAVICALPRYLARSLRIVLPYFPTGTKDRADDLGDVVTAKSLARLLSSIPMTRSGPAEIVIYDIHALGERFYFGDTVVPRFESGIHLLKDQLSRYSYPEFISIAFPDEGAWKRFGRKLGEYPQIICQKVRDGDRRVVSIKEGEVRGRHVVVVDDLVKTGGTLVECARVLYEREASYVHAWATHGVFPQ